MFVDLTELRNIPERDRWDRLDAQTREILRATDREIEALRAEIRSLKKRIEALEEAEE